MKLEKKVYADRSEKQKDFAIGVGVFFGLNALIYLLQLLVTSLLALTNAPEAESLGYLISCLAFPLQILANIGTLIYFTFTRTWIALGMLGIISLLMSLLVIIGIFSSIVCFLYGAAQ